jgi:4-hydroxybenzoate polyprenyltransferase
VSNLPTIWTNVLAGLVLSGASGASGASDPGAAVASCHAGSDPLERAPALALALSLFYVGGMYLNDYFDRDLDARERPERPIPSGQVRARTVLLAGVSLLLAGEAVVATLAWLWPDGTGWPPVAAGVALAAAILAYDAHHKGNRWSPVLMALCRVLVYVVAALSVAVTFPPALAVGCGVLLAYLAVLTWTAKHERRLRWAPPIGVLIAGISLVDAALVLAQGAVTIAAVCAACVPLTLALQRRVPGT